MRIVWGVLVAAPVLFASCAFAQTPKSEAAAVADVFYEAESKYMFGFIDGADIGNEGEKAFEYEAPAHFRNAAATTRRSSTNSNSSTCRRRISPMS